MRERPAITTDQRGVAHAAMSDVLRARRTRRFQAGTNIDTASILVPAIKNRYGLDRYIRESVWIINLSMKALVNHGIRKVEFLNHDGFMNVEIFIGISAEEPDSDLFLNIHIQRPLRQKIVKLNIVPIRSAPPMKKFKRRSLTISRPTLM